MNNAASWQSPEITELLRQQSQEQYSYGIFGLYATCQARTTRHSFEKLENQYLSPEEIRQEKAAIMAIKSAVRPELPLVPSYTTMDEVLFIMLGKLNLTSGTYIPASKTVVAAQILESGNWYVDVTPAQANLLLNQTVDLADHGLVVKAY